MVNVSSFEKIYFTVDYIIVIKTENVFGAQKHGYNL